MRIETMALAGELVRMIDPKRAEQPEVACHLAAILDAFARSIREDMRTELRVPDSRPMGL